MANERKVDLRVRAKDEFSGSLAKLEAAQKKIIEQNQRIAQLPPSDLAAFYGRTEVAVRKAEDGIRKLAQEFRTLSQAEGDNRAAMGKVLIEKGKLQAKAGELRASLRGVRETSHQLRTAQEGGIDAFARTARAMDLESNASLTLAERRENLARRSAASANSGFAAWSRSADGLTRQANAAGNTASQLNLVDQAAKRATASQTQLRAAVDRTEASLTRQSRRPRGDSGGRKGEAQDVEMYGLRPYQMVNLGYQVNDVISGLAMGQAPMQILAQQAGQFAQIWPNVMVGLVRSLPVLAGVTAALSPFIAALIRVRTEANSVKLFNTNLALMADGARYSAQGLAEMGAELQRSGVAIEEARLGLLALTKAGVDQTQIKAIAEMARDLSKVSGNKFSEEVERLSKAFTGNAQSIRELDKELQFLTADQLEQIYALERGGKAADAMRVAQDALRSRLAATRQELTPWQQALKDIADAWREFVGLITESTLFKDFMRDIGQLAKEFAAVARGIKAASDYISDAVNPTPNQRYERSLAKRLELEQALANLPQTFQGGMGLGSIDDQAAALRVELAKVNAEIAAMEAGMEAVADATEESGEAAGETSTATEERLKLQQDLQLALDEQLDALRREAELVQQTAKEQFVQNELLKAANNEKAKGLKLTEEQIEALRRQAEATFDATQSPIATGNYGSVVDRIVGVESSGNRFAKNKDSTATGLGQFIESTWLKMFREHFPDRAANMSRETILALRTDAKTSRDMVEIYARENAKVLQRAGVAVNDTALYLAHFLGPGGAVATLTANPNAQTSTFLGGDQIASNRSVLEGKTAAEVVAWAEKKMSITQQELGVQTRITELEQERTKEIQNYAEGYAKRIADQKFELDTLTQTARQAAILKAVRDEEARAAAANLKITEGQRAEIEATAAALFDRQNAELRVNELMEQRSLLAESLKIAEQAGDRQAMDSVIAQIQTVEGELRAAIDGAILFYQAMGGPAADQAILKLQNMKNGLTSIVEELDTKFLPKAEDLNEQLADVGGGAFSALAQAIGQSENALDSFWRAAQQGISDFLIAIGQAIVKQALFNAISGGTAGGGQGGTIAGAIGGLFGQRHTGGMVGAAANTRRVNPAVFAGAARYHSGGLVGRERAIIALQDEEVLTRDDPRHALNGGATPAANTKVVNVFDPADVLEAALQTTAGERIIMNYMTRNAGKLGSALS